MKIEKVTFTQNVPMPFVKGTSHEKQLIIPSTWAATLEHGCIVIRCGDSVSMYPLSCVLRIDYTDDDKKPRLKAV